MLTYLRRIDRSMPQRRHMFSGERPAKYEESSELPQDYGDRRLNRRVFDIWQEKCGSERWPTPDCICGRDLGEDWDKCFVLDVGTDYGFPKFEYLGSGLATMSGVFLSGQSEWKQTLLDKATEQVERAVRTERPVLCDDLLTLFDGSKLAFRSVLLPLGVDGRITHLLGAANGRVIEGDQSRTS